jgi:hypothetical protein
MDPARRAKLITRHESGLVTAAEAANSLLYDFLTEPGCDTAFVSSVQSLPDEVRHELVCLLRTIEEADYQWTPFLLPAPTIPFESAEHSAKLQRVCALLH